MLYQTIGLEKNGRLAYLTLNRPDQMNAMDQVMMKELAEALESLKKDMTVQVVVISGAGRAFSAGGDIRVMLDSEGIDMGDVMNDLSRLAKALYTLPQITIAAVTGAAAGLGFSLVLGCDRIIADESCKLAMNFIGIGLVPDGAGHFFLKERLGVTKAKHLIWSGELLDAQNALAKGLVDEVVPTGQAREAADKAAHQFLAMPIRAMIASKNILHSQKVDELQRVLEMENEKQMEMRQTEEHQEGIRAFLEKRQPNFSKGK
ncbi:enoyl-CoA hydratase [Bacillus sp. OxB-1]|uniref:enoyl-CoA hydratase n=1 Tax=Bacillus sp. (strain OxB-1) TaxID=98228 RepID=UPI000596CC5F|nr:enoyl-CoA hydratase [Bacillus sp. OxB-1]